MTTHAEQRKHPYTPLQLFTLVAEVDGIPHFTGALPVVSPNVTVMSFTLILLSGIRCCVKSFRPA